jgi:hypothetical protein
MEIGRQDIGAVAEDAAGTVDLQRLLIPAIPKPLGDLDKLGSLLVPHVLVGQRRGAIAFLAGRRGYDVPAACRPTSDPANRLRCTKCAAMAVRFWRRYVSASSHLHE